MQDFDLAALYEVEARVLNQAVKQNIKRFPGDFMFQLTSTEVEGLRSRIDFMQQSLSKRYNSALLYAFTEQGVSYSFSFLSFLHLVIII